MHINLCIRNGGEGRRRSWKPKALGVARCGYRAGIARRLDTKNGALPNGAGRDGGACVRRGQR